MYVMKSGFSDISKNKSAYPNAFSIPNDPSKFLWEEVKLMPPVIRNKLSVTLQNINLCLSFGIIL